MALIVAQSRDRKNRLSGILLTSLSQGLKRVAAAAKKIKGNIPFRDVANPIKQQSTSCG